MILIKMDQIENKLGGLADANAWAKKHSMKREQGLEGL